MSKISVILVLVIVALLFNGCGSSVATGSNEGGTTLEVIACRGVVRDSLGQGVGNVTMIARSVIMTGTGDSIVHVDSTVSMADGSYLFDSLPKGIYVITAGNSSVSGQMISSGIKPIDVILTKTHTIYGRIFTESDDSEYQFHIEIPGTKISVPIDSNGFYSLAGVSEGRQTLVITNGKIVNYLPIEISKTVADTVFIRDVRMVIDTGKVVSSYSLFPTKIAHSYSVVPLFYKPGSEPSWYKKNDYSIVNYFAVSKTGTISLYSPKVTQILHIGRMTVDDELIINRMTVEGYTVVHHTSSAVEEKDTTGCDLIFASSTVNLEAQGPMFKDATIPIITSSAEYSKKIGMVGSFSTTKSSALNFVASDPIADGFSGTVTVTTEPTVMEFGSIGSGAKTIAVDPTDSTKALIYLYGSGSSMVNGTGPALRIGFFTGKGCATVMNENGWKLFDQVIRRALQK